MIEYFKINKRKNTENTDVKVNIPKEIETKPKLKAYVVIVNRAIFALNGNEIDLTGKIYLSKEQARLNTKLLQLKHPYQDFKVYEMEVE